MYCYVIYFLSLFICLHHVFGFGARRRNKVQKKNIKIKNNNNKKKKRKHNTKGNLAALHEYWRHYQLPACWRWLIGSTCWHCLESWLDFSASCQFVSISNALFRKFRFRERVPTILSAFCLHVYVYIVYIRVSGYEITCNMFTGDASLALQKRWQLTKYDFNNKTTVYLLIFTAMCNNWKTTNKCTCRKLET